jgi:dTDP-4-dehydrorhamnose reductase
MTILVVGASGLVGSNVATLASEYYDEVIGTYFTSDPSLDFPCEKCDITDANIFKKLIQRHNPDLIVNCAAMTEVDACEETPKIAHAVNARAPKRLAASCADRDADLIHISTDYVFNGRQRRPYTEDDEPDPLQTYGQSKLAGERMVQDEDPSALIARLSFVYGVHRSSGDLSGFPAWVQSRLKADGEVSLFNDQSITPTRAGQVAETLLALYESTKSGRFHIACRDCVTPYEYGSVLAEQLEVSGIINECSRMDVDREASRPAYSCLDVTKVEQELNRRQPTLDEDLASLNIL